ncbi:unnamed protein product, partial [Ascophyllum nodosum]
NIGPGISPVTISTMDDSRKRPGSPGLASSTRRRRTINERSRHLDWEDHCADLDERGPDCFRRQYRMPQQTFKKTCRYTASPASTRPPFPRTLLD